MVIYALYESYLGSNYLRTFTEREEALRQAAQVAESQWPKEEWTEAASEAWESKDWGTYIGEYSDSHGQDMQISVHRCDLESEESAKSEEPHARPAEPEDLTPPRLRLSLNYTFESPIPPTVVPWGLAALEAGEDALDPKPVDSSLSLAWVGAQGEEVKDADDLMDSLLANVEGWQRR